MSKQPIKKKLNAADVCPDGKLAVSCGSINCTI
jgi:hypothetical protein